MQRRSFLLSSLTLCVPRKQFNEIAYFMADVHVHFYVRKR